MNLRFGRSAFAALIGLIFDASPPPAQRMEVGLGPVPYVGPVDPPGDAGPVWAGIAGGYVG